MFMSMKTPKLSQNQGGFAAITIALVLIIVLSLVTLGFTQLARREQQNALDKQLATQAYYAAESGINDVIKYLQYIPETNDPNECLNMSNPAKLPGAPAPLPSPKVNTGAGVYYTCVLVDKTLDDILFTNVGADEARQMVFKFDSAVDSFDIKWSSNSGTTTFNSAGGLPNKLTWNAARRPALLQFSITKLGSGALDRNTLINRQFTAYLWPGTGAGSVAYNPGGNQAPAVNANCIGSSVKTCTARITGLGGAAGDYFLVHVISYYADDTTIDLRNPTGGGHFVNGQALIDVTGQARTVLKRLQVRVAINGDGMNNPATSVPQPDNAIQAGDFCKRLATAPVTSSNTVGTTYKDTNGGNANSGDADSGACTPTP
jgi:hypothetical protein